MPAASECATSYGVFASGSQEISKTTGETSIALDVGSCESYEVSVIAAIGDKESDEVIVNAKTDPSEGAAEKLEIMYDVDVNSMTATWDGWAALPCVALYSAQMGHAVSPPKCPGAREQEGSPSSQQQTWTSAPPTP